MIKSQKADTNKKANKCLIKTNVRNLNSKWLGTL